MGNQKYDLTRLMTIMNRDNARIIGIYPYLTHQSNITFECMCNNVYTKKFRVLVRRCGAFCETCTKNMSDFLLVTED